MTLLHDLHSEFTDFVQGRPSLPTFAPAFFMEDVVAVAADTAFRPVGEETPFSTCWIVYRIETDVGGKVTNKVLLEDRVAKVWMRSRGAYTTMDSYFEFNLDDPVAKDPPHQVTLETLPELRYCLNRITTHEREEAIPQMLVKMNKRRVKNQLRQLPPFITIKNTRRVVEGEGVGARTGVTMSPHERRGHTRFIKKSGITVNVKPSRIHGGSDVRRDYRVE